MTNGEKIIEIVGRKPFIDTCSTPYMLFNKDWCNAEYKEPTTKNNLANDCISRKAAEDITWQDPSYTDPLNILTEVRDKIRELPSVTPQEPKTGHWIPIYQGDEIIDYRCSECEFGNTFGRGTFGMDFCPRCGADMREVVEE